MIQFHTTPTIYFLSPSPSTLVPTTISHLRHLYPTITQSTSTKPTTMNTIQILITIQILTIIQSLTITLTPTTTRNLTTIQIPTTIQSRTTMSHTATQHCRLIF